MIDASQIFSRGLGIGDESGAPSTEPSYIALETSDLAVYA
jgi:hypothetical protein